MDQRDVARIARVSSATVSRVLNGSTLVKPATAERVRRVIEQLRFIPNGSAAALRYGKSSSYGLIIPDITNPFFSEFIRSFQEILADRNRDVLMASLDHHASGMQESIRRMMVRQVNGIALLAAEIESGPIEALVHNRVPLVTMDRRLTGPGLSDIAIHNASGMNEALEHLHALGHRRIGYIGGASGLTISDHRQNAFIKAVKRVGLTVDPAFLREGNYRISGGEAAIQQILAMKTRPTALLTANDLTAIGVLRVLHKSGCPVPQAFSVVGFDDIELSDVIYPPLTTLRLARQELAQTFVTALEALATDPHAAGNQYTVRTRLVVRESTGPAPR
ncbi:MAG TPA: LacI family DNA-binding transcriptional regulator [Acidobacteriaceae bacterium]|jgi:LacI family transcriptional regulator|nr:LacI family DNA-binding transcriptional regulator [Acidobacteriaceae bacterium]